MLVKRIVYECPIEHMSDEFFKLLFQYHSHELSQVSLQENAISSFFSLCEVVRINRQIPIRVGQDNQIEREQYHLEEACGEKTIELRNTFLHADLADTEDPFTKDRINLKEIVDRAFLNQGRLFYH